MAFWYFFLLALQVYRLRSKLQDFFFPFAIQYSGSIKELGSKRKIKVFLEFHHNFFTLNPAN